MTIVPKGFPTKFIFDSHVCGNIFCRFALPIWFIGSATCFTNSRHPEYWFKKKNTSQRNLLERISIENGESRSFLRCQINQNGQSGSVHADFHSAIRTKIAFALLTSGCIFDEIGSRFPRYISYTQMARKKKNKMQIRNQKGSLRDSCPCFDYIWLPLKLRLIASEWAEVPFYLEYQ